MPIWTKTQYFLKYVEFENDLSIDARQQLFLKDPFYVNTQVGAEIENVSKQLIISDQTSTSGVQWMAA